MFRKPRGFTRIELLSSIAALGLLAMVAVPALANGRSASDRAVCWSNLRSIGRAVQIWANDHNGQPPWWILIDSDILPVGGGTLSLKPAAAWYEYAVLSNYLGSPRIAACPADIAVAPAFDWGTFISSTQGRGKALSYTLNLHASADSPQAWLATDLNIAFDRSIVNCEANIVGADAFLENTSSALAWTNGAAHGDHGHVLLNDGGVQFTSTPRWREIAFNPAADRLGQGTNHFLRAR